MNITPRLLKITILAVITLTVNLHSVSAATGDELLASSLPASSMNKGVIDGETLVKAVYQAVIANKDQAPEIVGAAIPKTRSIKTQEAIVKAAVSALGSSTKRVPQIVYSAIKSSPNCGTSDGKSGYSKESPASCECAVHYVKAAIEALGANPSEKLVIDITTAAIQATEGRCARQIADAASQAAPQYASSIADAAARAGREGGNNFDPGSRFGDSELDGVVFSPTGRPVPAPFVFPPATNGGIVPDTTPVN